MLPAVAAIVALAALAAPAALAAAGATNPAPAPGQIVGDAMPAALTTQPGDAARGRALVVSRQQGLCLLCHSGPFPEERVPGTVSTNLAGTGSRWSVAQLRLRVADARVLNPASVMPSFHRVDAASEAERRVAAGWRGRPILDAQQLEDVVAFLATLRD
jgi:sulfur-oxidizing protein SoxX